jgi:hypothetical protein
MQADPLSETYSNLARHEFEVAHKLTNVVASTVSKISPIKSAGSSNIARETAFRVFCFYVCGYFTFEAERMNTWPIVFMPLLPWWRLVSVLVAQSLEYSLKMRPQKRDKGPRNACSLVATA